VIWNSDGSDLVSVSFSDAKFVFAGFDCSSLNTDGIDYKNRWYGKIVIDAGQRSWFGTEDGAFFKGLRMTIYGADFIKVEKAISPRWQGVVVP